MCGGARLGHHVVLEVVECGHEHLAHAEDIIAGRLSDDGGECLRQCGEEGSDRVGHDDGRGGRGGGVAGAWALSCSLEGSRWYDEEQLW